MREPEYLPLRILRDSELIAERAPQADPLLGVLAALGSMPPGWRAVAQLVLSRRRETGPVAICAAPSSTPSSPSAPNASNRAASASSGWGGVVASGGVPGGGDRAAAAVGALPGARLAPPRPAWSACNNRSPGLYALWLRLVDRPLYDLELVKEKLSRPAARAELRLAVFAPTSVTPADVQARLEHVAAAYHAYDLERGNGLVARSLALPERSGRAVRARTRWSSSTLGHPHDP